MNTPKTQPTERKVYNKPTINEIGALFDVVRASYYTQPNDGESIMIGGDMTVNLIHS